MSRGFDFTTGKGLGRRRPGDLREVCQGVEDEHGIQADDLEINL